MDGRPGGARGATLAGIALTSGFAGGPVVSGLAVVACLLTARTRMPERTSARADGARPDPPRAVSTGTALARALPIAPLVFTTATIGLVVLPTRLPGSLARPALAGIGAGIILGTGLLAQAWRRRRGSSAGVLGAVCGAAGLAVVAPPARPPPWCPSW